jgi:hypothetical protein
MALLIGILSRENNPAVLDAVAQATQDNPEEGAPPLVSINKTAAVLFARAAGEYSALSILRLKHKTSFSEVDWEGMVRKENGDPTIDDLVNVLLRMGSPFEATAAFNQRFGARDFLTIGDCPFKELFNNDRNLTMESDLTDVTRLKPPTAGEVDASLLRAINAATTLERSSYILGQLAENKWTSFQARSDLFGTAVVVGQVSPRTINNLRSKGGFYSSVSEVGPNPGCRTPQTVP